MSFCVFGEKGEGVLVGLSEAQPRIEKVEERSIEQRGSLCLP